MERGEVHVDVLMVLTAVGPTIATGSGEPDDLVAKQVTGSMSSCLTFEGACKWLHSICGRAQSPKVEVNPFR
jgi:hypothetical protein